MYIVPIKSNNGATSIICRLICNYTVSVLGKDKLTILTSGAGVAIRGSRGVLIIIKIFTGKSLAKSRAQICAPVDNSMGDCPCLFTALL